MKLKLVSPANSFSTDILFDESLMLLAKDQPHASIWRTNQCLVVPRTYKKFNNFDLVCQEFNAKGWPVYVRNSGGGVVPQGPGIINVSLAYAVDGLPLDNSDQAYLNICDILAKVASNYGIETIPTSVQGSFCDGRFNLAYVDDNNQVKKIAGTAQIWRKNIVLVHALFMIACDIKSITQAANLLEQKLGNHKQYSEASAISLHTLCNTTTMTNSVFENQIINDLSSAISGFELVL